MLPTFLTANGLDFALLEAKPAVRSPASPKAARKAPLVLLLHGFPDSAWSWQPMLEGLAAQGFHAVAPFMRGYLPTSIPRDGDYSLGTLARDVIALIDHLGADKAYVVGHDWGAVAGYAAAALRPDRMVGLVAVSIPHLRRFLLRPTLAQLQRSSYMLRFQQRGIEPQLAANHCAELKALVQRWSPKLNVETALAPVWAAFTDPARVGAALGYYRALPAALLDGSLPLVMSATPVPTCVVHGAVDGCIAQEMFTAQSHLFMRGVESHCLPLVGHFLPQERADLLLEVLLEFCRKCGE
jgi:pimeloyl-ACP methyl ester carboxylesterase